MHATIPASKPPVVPEADRPLPRYDIWLLPAIAILTMALLFAGSEAIARGIWPEQRLDPCKTPSALGIGHYRSNCTSTIKSPESPWVTSTYNECGYRTGESCGPKIAGSIRIAVLGSSSSYGYLVPYQETYTTLLTGSLSRRCQRPVEFQNLGYEENNLLEVYRETNEAIALKPDLLLVALTPIDVRRPIDANAFLHRDDPVRAAAGKGAAHPASWLHAHIIGPISESRAVYMLQSAMYHNPETFLKLYLLHGDEAGFLKSTFPPLWQKQLADTDALLDEMAAKAASAGIPIVLVVVPHTADAAVLEAQPEPGLSATAFSSAMTRIAAKHGIPTIDGIAGLASVSDPIGLFYLVDGHLRERGEKVLANEIGDQLPSVEPTVFQGCLRGR